MRKTFQNRILASILCLLLTALATLSPGTVVYGTPPTFSVAVSSGETATDDESRLRDETEQLNLISALWQSINEGDWLAWANLYTPVEREDRLALVQNEQNHQEHIGILTITHVNMKEVMRVDNSYAPWIYSELHPYYEDENSCACYRVCLDISVAEDNGYYSSGECYQLLVLVKDDESWGIGAMCSCPDDLLPGSNLNHENPFYAIKNKNYIDAYIIFPTDYIEYYGSDAPDRQEPFDVSFVLPRGWSYRELGDGNCAFLSTWVNDESFDHSIVLIYNSSNVCVGAVGFAKSAYEYSSLYPLFASLETDEIRCSYETSCITVSRQLENPSTNVTAISQMVYYQQAPNEDAPTASAINPIILSYSAERGVFITFEFKPTALNGLQLMDIAEGIRIY